MMSARRLSFGSQVGIVAACALAFSGAVVLLSKPEHLAAPARGVSDYSSKARPAAGRFYPTDAQWAALSVEPAGEHRFRMEFDTEGKIAVNDDSSTPIFSPYAGRVIKLLSKPGEHVDRGQPLFILEATDTVQGLNDFVAALSVKNTAASKLHLAEIVEKRANSLYSGKAVPLKDWQQAQADLAAAQNDVRASETAVEAARNRLRILGRSDQAIALFEQKRQIEPDTPIYAPIGGTVVQRKVGPGQYVNSGASDPAFVIGDLSTVWLVAFVRETDAAHVGVGQEIAFRVMAAPGRTFRGRLNYVAAAFDPTTRRLLVRATIDNADGLLKPEMFANVTLFSNDGSPNGPTAAVPRSAILYEGDAARLWVAHDDRSIELRKIKIGLSDGNLMQVLNGVRAGEKVVTGGALFIDRTATES